VGEATQKSRGLEKVRKALRIQSTRRDKLAEAQLRKDVGDAEDREGTEEEDKGCLNRHKTLEPRGTPT